MSIHLLRKDIAIEPNIPAIAEIKNTIAQGLLELNAHAARGTLTSYGLTQDRVNKSVDTYIAMRKLSLVQS